MFAMSFGKSILFVSVVSLKYENFTAHDPPNVRPRSEPSVFAVVLLPNDAGAEFRTESDRR